MEFCGGHTHAIARYGITDLLPPNVRLIHGPGCPVCALPVGRIDDATVPDHKACACGAILRGLKRPTDCALFAAACTPESPRGACMVSAEGACAAHYTYARFRDHTYGRFRDHAPERAGAA